jgi:hypothetical protein
MLEYSEQYQYCFIIYTVFHGAFVVSVDCFKYCQYEARMGMSIENLFNLLSK